MLVSVFSQNWKLEVTLINQTILDSRSTWQTRTDKNNSDWKCNLRCELPFIIGLNAYSVYLLGFYYISSEGVEFSPVGNFLKTSDQRRKTRTSHLVCEIWGYSDSTRTFLGHMEYRNDNWRHYRNLASPSFAHLVDNGLTSGNEYMCPQFDLKLSHINFFSLDPIKLELMTWRQGHEYLNFLKTSSFMKIIAVVKA